MHWCQVQNVRSVLVVLISVVTADDAVACPASQYHPHSVVRSGTAGPFPGCSLTLGICVQSSEETIEIRCREPEKN